MSVSCEYCVLSRGDLCDGSIARSEGLIEYGVSKKACAHKVYRAIKTVYYVLFVCFLFSWRYNPLWLYCHSPVAGFSLLVSEVS
jgi:hypothetical protein